VTVGRGLGRRGWSWTSAAGFLNVGPRTLRRWRANATRAAGAVSLGRPPARSPRSERTEVLRVLDERGPGIGLAVLREVFPRMARAELANLLTRYRRVWRHRHRRPLCVLEWTTPGRVWAMDFADPPAPVDGRFPNLLAVRDLASGRQLLWQPLPAATADAARSALASLVARHGPPLLVKSDNGSAFGAAPVAELFAEIGVESLFSPPRMPSYNGAIEAGIGSLKTRTEAHAARHDRPGQWTWDDAEAARAEANATARLRGPTGPSPDQSWATRQPVTADERTRFRETVARLRREDEAEAGPPQEEMTRRARDRQILRRALEERGYLLYARRRIPLPIPRPNAVNIT
jgi:transposase InsO family protein